jgi:hypothetical protein
LAEDNPVTGGIVPLVVEVRESVSQRGVFWTERLLVGVEDQVLLDTTQLTGGEYDANTEEMVYRVLTPWWALAVAPTDTFVWTQAQWVGVPMDESNASAYREGNAHDAMDVAVDHEGALTVFKGTSSNAKTGTGTRAGASTGTVGNGLRVVPERHRRRSVDALRKEAQRRWQQARRNNKTKRGGKVVASSKSAPRTAIKRSHSGGGPDATLVWCRGCPMLPSPRRQRRVRPAATWRAG